MWGANVSVTRELRIGEANGAASYVFSGIAGVTVSPDGNIFVAERQPAQVRMYDASGKFVKQLARAGQGPGELASPQTLSFFRDHLYVRDGMNSRIAVLNIAGGAPAQWPYRSNSVSQLRMTITDECGSQASHKDRPEFSTVHALRCIRRPQTASDVS